MPDLMQVPSPTTLAEIDLAIRTDYDHALSADPVDFVGMDLGQRVRCADLLDGRVELLAQLTALQREAPSSTPSTSTRASAPSTSRATCSPSSEAAPRGPQVAALQR